jgi:hypothetical protein
VERYYGVACDLQAELLLEPPPPPPPPQESDAAAMCLEADQTSRYVTSVYWALMTISTVGYGDITAQTDLEKVASSFTMLFGALVFAGITGQMASRFMASKGAVQIFNTRMDEIRQYLRDKNVGAPQRRAIEAHFSLLWGKTAIYNEAEILELLPRTLRSVLSIVQIAALRTALFLSDDVNAQLPVFAETRSGQPHTESNQITKRTCLWNGQGPAAGDALYPLALPRRGVQRARKKRPWSRGPRVDRGAAHDDGGQPGADRDDGGRVRTRDVLYC